MRSDASMKTKYVLAVLVVLVATFIYPDVTTWLVPLLIGVVTLRKFRKNEVAKYIGLLSLKPTFMMLLSMLVASFGFLEQLYSLYSYEIVSAIFWIIPELILTLVIFYSFRHLFGANKLIWLFLIADTIRWLVISIEFLIPDPFPEPYFYTQLYILVFFLLIFPSLYAIVGFISVRERVLSKNNTH